MALANNGWNDLNTIRNINQNLEPIFGLHVDIHLYSRQIGANCLAALRLDQQDQLSSNARNFETVATEILAHSKNNPNVATVLNSIRANRNAIENETGLKYCRLTGSNMGFNN